MAPKFKSESNKVLSRVIKADTVKHCLALDLLWTASQIYMAGAVFKTIS